MLIILFLLVLMLCLTAISGGSETSSPEREYAINPQKISLKSDRLNIYSISVRDIADYNKVLKMGDGYVHQESVDKEVIKWGKYFIAKYRDTGKIAAIMALKFARAGYLKGKLVLRGSITVPEFRRQGLQKEMQYAVLESLPIKYVYSQVAIDNVNMIQMTKSMGYKLIYSDKKYNYYRINSEEIR